MNLDRYIRVSSSDNAHNLYSDSADGNFDVIDSSYYETKDDYENSIQHRDDIASSENVDDIIKNAKLLKSNAGNNQISKLHARVSKLTGLRHPALGNNPLFGVSDDMILSANNAHEFHGSVKSPATLLAIWVKEGGAKNHKFFKKKGLSGIFASSIQNAKSIFRSELYFFEMGIDKFIAYTSQKKGDNIAFPFDDVNARAHEAIFLREVDKLHKSKYLSRNFVDSINDSLEVKIISKVNSKINRYEIKPNNHFYIYSLLLVDALFREFEIKTKKIMKSSSMPDFGLRYMCWNMGEGKFKTFIKSAELHRFEKKYLSSGISPSIAKWAFEFPAKSNEWPDPRNNASKIRYFRDVFDLVFTKTKSSNDSIASEFFPPNFFIPQPGRQAFNPSYRSRLFRVASTDAILRDENFNPLNANYVTSEIGKNSKGYGILKKGNSHRVLRIKILSNGKALAQVASKIRTNVPLGWTVPSNFIGGLRNETVSLKKAQGNVASHQSAYTVANRVALIRNPMQNFKSTGISIPIGTFVDFISFDQSQKYAKVVYREKLSNRTLEVWTSKSNLIKKWIPILGPNSAWKRGKFIGLIDLVNIVGTKNKIRQISKSSLSAYQRLVKAATNDGVQIVLESGFRTFSHQKRLYDGYISGKPGYNKAAKPGRSNHQNGIAFDLNTTGNGGRGWGTVYDWLKDNATSYGFLRTEDDEHWHWEYNPNRAVQLKARGKYYPWDSVEEIQFENQYLYGDLLDSRSNIRIARSDNYDQFDQNLTSDHENSDVHLRNSDTLVPGQINWRKILNKFPNTIQGPIARLNNPYTCGFYGKTKVVSKTKLVKKIISVAEAEHARWVNGNSKFEEDDASVLKHLVHYWLSVIIKDVHASPSKLNTIQTLLPLQNLTIRSNSTTAANTLNRLISGRLSTKIKSAIDKAKKSANNKVPWSAAYIVSCVRKAVIELDLEWEENGVAKGEGKVLALGGSHSKYGRPAYLRRRRNVSGCYQAFGRTEHPIEEGDIIITDRRANGIRSTSKPCNRSPFGFRQVRSSYRDLSRQPACTHGDIVIKVDSATNSVITLGGNVGDSVRKRRYPINAQGYLDINHTTQRIYSQEADDGTLAATTTLPANAALHSKSTSRIFAVLKLVENCRVIPGTPYKRGLIT